MKCFAIILYLTYTAMGVKSHEELRNVAYGKKVYLSSHPGNPNPYPGSNAVNGNLGDFAHTAVEQFPRLLIDLRRKYLIHEIEVFARSDCCHNQLHDLDVKVGNHVDHMEELCGHATGPARINGERIAIWCPNNTIARFVELKIVVGRENVLTPAEVIVWGKKPKLS